ncbi:MAG TPA: hypothetical protein VFB58_04865 [Chloroflexota bacterium]|nr:hypothetical protein [Chloroflexota bacterium]
MTLPLEASCGNGFGIPGTRPPATSGIQEVTYGPVEDLEEFFGIDRCAHEH